MKNLAYLFVFTIFFSFSAIAQKDKKQEISSQNFDVFLPNEDGRPSQFLTTYLRTHKRLNLNRTIKKILQNPNRYDNPQKSMRSSIQFGNATSSLTHIFLDNEEIFGEGINRLFVIENTRTSDIKKITRSNVGYDKEIRIYTEKFLEQ